MVRKVYVAIVQMQDGTIHKIPTGNCRNLELIGRNLHQEYNGQLVNWWLLPPNNLQRIANLICLLEIEPILQAPFPKLIEMVGFSQAGTKRLAQILEGITQLEQYYPNAQLGPKITDIFRAALIVQLITTPTVP